MATAFVQLATPPRLDDRTSTGGLSLDGLAFFSEADEIVDPDDTDGEWAFEPADDLPLIRWLQDHVSGVVTDRRGAGLRLHVARADRACSPDCPRSSAGRTTRPSNAGTTAPPSTSGRRR